VSEQEYQTEITATLYWDWTEGDPGTWDTPPDPPHPEDVELRLQGHMIDIDKYLMRHLRRVITRYMEDGHGTRE